jgi:hypothetical protein
MVPAGIRPVPTDGKEAGMATDLSISLPDEPGGLAKAAKALGEAGVNVEGIAGLGGGGHGHVHLLVEDGGAARSALEGAGVTIEGEREAVVVDVSNEDRPGKLGEVTQGDRGRRGESRRLLRGVAFAGGVLLGRPGGASVGARRLRPSTRLTPSGTERRPSLTDPLRRRR